MVTHPVLRALGYNLNVMLPLATQLTCMHHSTHTAHHTALKKRNGLEPHACKVPVGLQRCGGFVEHASQGHCCAPLLWLACRHSRCQRLPHLSAASVCTLGLRSVLLLSHCSSITSHRGHCGQLMHDAGLLCNEYSLFSGLIQLLQVRN